MGYHGHEDWCPAPAYPCKCDIPPRETVDEFRTELARVKAKLQKLKALILLIDPVVSGEIVNDIALKQWNEFIREFPDEGEKDGE